MIKMFFLEIDKIHNLCCLLISGAPHTWIMQGKVMKYKDRAMRKIWKLSKNKSVDREIMIKLGKEENLAEDKKNSIIFIRSHNRPR